VSLAIILDPARAATLALPALVVQAGPAAAARFVDFFAVTLRNPNTRQAYVHAVRAFLDWAQERELVLERIQPVHVAAYIEALSRRYEARTVKQHLAALRGLFGWLVTGGVLDRNPAADVRGPAAHATGGRTPVLFEDDTRRLLDAIDVSHVVGLRDRALIAVMLYSFARISAVVSMRVRDYEVMGTRAWLLLHEKGGKRHRVPAHHQLVEALEAYLDAAGIRDELDAPLFRSTRGRTRILTERALDRVRALRMVKRRAADAGLPPHAVWNHTFRATGVTNFMQNGGTLEAAAQIAAHASTRTTQLYNRNPDRIALSEIERVRF
jgi:site-specific recombinase XerD